MKRAAALIALVFLSACASAARTDQMVATQPASGKPFPAKLQRAMCVRSVAGGESTNPLWVSKVDNQSFLDALAASLASSGLQSAAGCPYTIDTNLLGLAQPRLSITTTVTAHVNYKVYDAKGQPLLLATIESPFTSEMSDAVLPGERLRLANEGAIRASIAQFFDRLRATAP